MLPQFKSERTTASKSKPNTVSVIVSPKVTTATTSTPSPQDSAKAAADARFKSWLQVHPKKRACMGFSYGASKIAKTSDSCTISNSVKTESAGALPEAKSVLISSSQSGGYHPDSIAVSTCLTASPTPARQSSPTNTPPATKNDWLPVQSGSAVPTPTETTAPPVGVVSPTSQVSTIPQPIISQPLTAHLPLVSTPTITKDPAPTAVPQTANLILNVQPVHQSTPQPTALCASPIVDHSTISVLPTAVSAATVPTTASASQVFYTNIQGTFVPLPSPIVQVFVVTNPMGAQPQHQQSTLTTLTKCAESTTTRLMPIAPAPLVLSSQPTMACKPPEVTRRRLHACTFENCQKTYLKSSHLKAHMRSHTGKALFHHVFFFFFFFFFFLSTT